MGKHDEQKDHNENDGLDDDSFQDEVARILKDHSKEYISELEEIGFVYCDDENDEEEQEEALAKPENKNQKYLVSFFNGDIPLSAETVEIFLEERRNPTPNYPLFRKYFKQANKHLLSLILYALHHYPVGCWWRSGQPSRFGLVEFWLRLRPIAGLAI